MRHHHAVEAHLQARAASKGYENVVRALRRPDLTASCATRASSPSENLAGPVDPVGPIKTVIFAYANVKHAARTSTSPGWRKPSRDAAGHDALDRQHAGDRVAVFPCTESDNVTKRGE